MSVQQGDSVIPGWCYEPTLWSNDGFEKLVLAQLANKFSAFYGTTRFIAVLKKVATGPCHPKDSSTKITKDTEW